MIEPHDDVVPLASGVELHVRRWEPSEPTQDTAPWLLTHGLASNARLWDGAARRLADLGHRVVAVDQRGHGRSSKPDGPYDVATCADDLALLIEAIGFTRDHRPAVAGQSWGGNVVLELGFRHPDLVTHVACVDGGFIDLQSRFPAWDTCAAALAPPRLAGTPVEQIRGWLDESMSDWPPESRDATMANFDLRPDGTVVPWLTHDRHLAVLRGLWGHRPSARYPQMSVPVLLIAAETGDVDWSHSKEDAIEAALQALPRGRAHWFRPAHHDVHAQHPDEVAALLHRSVTDPTFFTERHEIT